MAMRTVKKLLALEAWDGTEEAIKEAGMPDDATFLQLQMTPEGNSISCSIDDGDDPPALALLVRARRLNNGVPSGTGTPPELAIEVLSAAGTVATGVIKPGRFWHDYFIALPAGVETQSVSALLSATAVDRQVAISRLVIDAAPEGLPPAEPLPQPEPEPEPELQTPDQGLAEVEPPPEPEAELQAPDQGLAEVEPPPEAIDFQAMTKAQIVQHCSTAYGVALDSSQTKAALIEQAAALEAQAWIENGN